MALARGGQTLLTGAAREALGDALPDGAEIEATATTDSKGIEEPVEMFELGARDALPFAPPADVDKAYRVVRARRRCGARCARCATTCPPSATRSSAAAPSCARWRDRLDAGARLSRCSAPAAPARRASCAATAGPGSATGRAASSSAT